eukprot:1161727-Pelagomonas_calceolata.AAC.15
MEYNVEGKLADQGTVGKGKNTSFKAGGKNNQTFIKYRSRAHSAAHTHTQYPHEGQLPCKIKHIRAPLLSPPAHSAAHTHTPYPHKGLLPCAKPAGDTKAVAVGQGG